ncbi:MAG: protein-export chaperone SecB [Sphaerochaeta sp.]
MQKSDFQLDSHRIVRTDFSLNREFTIPKNMQVDLAGKTEVKSLSETSSMVIFSFSVYKNKPLEEVPFQIDVVSEGIFSWDPTIPKEQLSNYLNYNAPSVLLSYIRSVISMITAYAGLPTVMIPLINFYKPSRKEEEKVAPASIQND